MSFWDEIDAPAKHDPQKVFTGPLGSPLGTTPSQLPPPPPPAQPAGQVSTFVAMVMEAALPDGRKLVVCQDDAGADAIIDQLEKDAVVWTLSEVAMLLADHPMLNAVKRQFPGAKVTASRRVKPEPEFFDDLPEGLREETPTPAMRSETR